MSKRYVKLERKLECGKVYSGKKQKEMKKWTKRCDDESTSWNGSRTEEGGAGDEDRVAVRHSKTLEAGTSDDGQHHSFT